MRNVQVAVVGRGPTALLSALGLAQRGIQVAVLQDDGEVSDPSPVFCHWSVLPGLAGLGVLEDLVDAGRREDRWSFRVYRTGEEITFDLKNLAQDTDYPYNVYVESSAFRAIVEQHLARHSHAQVERGLTVAAVEPTQASVNIGVVRPDGQQEMVRAEWVVGADGVRSQVRRSVGLGFMGLTWQERWVALEVAADLSSLGYESTTYQIDSRLGAVVRQLPGSHAWRYLYTEPLTLPEDSLQERARTEIETVLGVTVSSTAGVATTGRMHERSAPVFRLGRVILAGQAARVANPLTAYGTTGDFFDAYMLADALVDVIGAPDDERPLDGYAESRRRTFLEFTTPWSADRTHLVFQIEDPEKLDLELEPYRLSSRTPAAQREFLLTELEMGPDS